MKVDKGEVIKSAPAEDSYDGVHVLLDMFGVDRLDDPALIEEALVAAADAAGATVIGSNLHHFGPEQGVTGVLLLAESHISIHTWPERGYAAIDLFLCGKNNRIDAAIDKLIAMLGPETFNEQRFARGFEGVDQPEIMPVGS